MSQQAEVLEEIETASDFSYVVIQSSETHKSAWKVVRRIIHPNYFLDWRDLLLSANKSARYKDFTTFDTNMAQIRSQINKIDHDIALLKVEEDNLIFNKSMADNRDVGELKSTPDDSHSEINTQNKTQNLACVELAQQGQAPARKTSIKNASHIDSGAFKFPSEKRRYEVNSRNVGTLTRASCVAVGHSPVSMR